MTFLYLPSLSNATAFLVHIAGSESLPVGENRYQCRYCDNTFHYANPDTPKVTKNITVQESNHCPVCGRGVTSGTSNLCMYCGLNDICSNCIFETAEKKISCKNCTGLTIDDKEITDLVAKTSSQINNTLKGIGFDANRNEILKINLGDLFSKLSKQSGIKYLIIDGIVTQKLVDKAKQTGIKCIIGHKTTALKNLDGTLLRTFTDLGVE